LDLPRRAVSATGAGYVLFLQEARRLRRIVLASNRVLNLTAAAQAGGVSVALADILKTERGLWFGWSGDVASETDDLQDVRIIKAGASGSATATVPISEAEHRDYYLGYSNSVLWPVFHNRLDLAEFESGYYPSYRDVNARFARQLHALLEPDDVIWVHDYHLIPLAEELRKLGVTAPIGFFLHIPAPPPQTFLAIPEYVELARALSAYDLIGVQTQADVANLISFFEDAVGGRILPDSRINVLERRLAIASFPVGINLPDFHSSVPVPMLAQSAPAAMRIIGIDRLDYTKGLPQKFRAYERFLEKYKAYRGQVVLSQIAPPTREDVEAYSDIRRTLEHLSGSINGRFGEMDWVPIHYIHRTAARKRLRDIYRASRICMVTPLRDGMNLVAKEYIAAQDPDDPGVVILSRFAGAAEQLKDALIVNPYNIEEVADAIKEGLEMPLDERQRRHAKLFKSISTYDTFTWRKSFLRALEMCARERHRASGSHSEAIRKALDKVHLAHSIGKAVDDGKGSAVPRVVEAVKTRV
jgi:trehalose 6-phosphate synthase